MKSLITLSLCMLVGSGITYAQTSLYSQNFNTGSASEWTLNTSDLGGVTSMTPNFWVINNVYAGDGILIGTTPDEPSGVTGSPESYYLHITSALGVTLGAENCTYNASGTHSYFAAMNTPITTTGYSNVSLGFWWICKGNANAVGEIFYRTSATAAWTQISTASIPPAAVDSYNMENTWQQVTALHLDSFDNQAYLEFGLRFRHAASGSDPAFGLDDITLVGTPASVSPPVASFSSTATTACQDSCITFTSTSTGTVDSVRWTATGATITSPTSASTSICFPAAGAYTVSLEAYNSGGNNTTSTDISVTPTPAPAITQTGNTLSVTGAYTSYQWANALTFTPIAGATNASFTFTATGTYAVVVDSDGCYGYGGPITITTLGIANVGGTANSYWLSQPGDNSIILHASSATADDLDIAIYDATGRTIFTDKWLTGNTAKTINTMQLPPSLYIIKLNNSNTSKVFRWINK